MRTFIFVFRERIEKVNPESLLSNLRGSLLKIDLQGKVVSLSIIINYLLTDTVFPVGVRQFVKVMSFDVPADTIGAILVSK